MRGDRGRVPPTPVTSRGLVVNGVSLLLGTRVTSPMRRDEVIQGNIAHEEVVNATPTGGSFTRIGVRIVHLGNRHCIYRE